ncbi:Similar to Putative nicotinamide N-methyltransferase; acc. no. Q4I2X5 [Pyronema omphalodes CBS 100304]|uniref:Similar to Putative nicotinamide N-methyltransferase acc. no. Q4I2X5 n=1 Tax=Pyronema omphalodes (strain CBS 100304) TaxID=1076935 RepID=U4LBV3_PYROM|nr:Similar to Putative nicotinamide N-methyltransferase; acc. no. Q4I2X5 [Pyronema omphalodes CBS 100304]
MTTSSPTREEILISLSTNGYVILPSLIPPALLSPLREAAARTIAKARLDWPHVRVVGKQFPPWPTGARDDVWGVQHIMHPDLQEPVFAEWYGCDELVEAVTTILQCEEKDIQLELCNLLINPHKTPFSLAWHRDAIPPATSDAEEIELLKAPRGGTQWNTALLDDECLLVVPGSHRRARTAEERRITIDDPRAPIPGELVVKLKAGDTVFYDNNILHRAVYPTNPERVTLHACMGTVGAGWERARNILQHGMEWVKEVKYDGRLEEMRGRLVRMEDEVVGKEVGYSLPEETAETIVTMVAM